MEPRMHHLIAKCIEELGYDLSDPHLSGSPLRIARFWREWHTKKQPLPALTTFPADGVHGLVTVAGLRFYSLCAHHGLPFFGQAAVGYIPAEIVVGLSKIPRVLDHFAHRFQTQERLTEQVADYLAHELSPLGLGVVLRA